MQLAFVESRTDVDGASTRGSHLRAMCVHGIDWGSRKTSWGGCAFLNGDLFQSLAKRAALSRH